MEHRERDDFVHALDVDATNEEVAPGFANYRALTWSRVTVASGKAEADLLLSLAVDQL